MGEHGCERVLRMGVLGCADIALRRMLPVIAAHESARIVAVASRDSAKAALVSDRFGCSAVTGYQRLLDRDDIDAVYIPVPPGLHHEWVVRALEAGKHVLAEKPLCTAYEEAVDLMRLARRLGLVLAENFMFLHHSQHATVRSLVEDGTIGELQVFSSSFGVPPLDPASFRYRPDLGGGALLDVGVYPLRAAQLLLGPELEVRAATLRIDEATGVDVAGSVLLSTPDCVSAQLDFGFQHSYRCSYALWGSRGRISVDRAFTPPEQIKPLVRVQQQDRYTELAVAADHQVRNALGAFVDAVLSGAGGPLAEDETLLQARLVSDVRGAAKVALVKGHSRQRPTASGPRATAAGQ
ncbi:Gfo/Idh/MocA family protein [Streptomyces sp. MMS24-I31]|uniref:Gfo/Idh/MocA family protein n=1 Tax=Streptomyces sp. MMS24-I31 TaxID=3351563 RepID=UPI003896B675